MSPTISAVGVRPVLMGGKNIQPADTVVVYRIPSTTQRLTGIGVHALFAEQSGEKTINGLGGAKNIGICTFTAVVVLPSLTGYCFTDL